MKTPMRLVAKMKLSMNVALLFMCLAGTAGFMMVMDASKEMTPKIQLLSWGFGLSFIGVLVSLGLHVKYGTQRRGKWRDHVRAWGPSSFNSANLLDKMHKTPSGDEQYTFDQAHALMTACLGSTGSLVTPLSRGFKDLQVLERRGWIFLTFSDPKNEGGGDDVVARPTEQAWASVEEMCPRDWSPEDRIIGPMASYI